MERQVANGDNPRLQILTHDVKRRDNIYIFSISSSHPNPNPNSAADANSLKIDFPCPALSRF